MIADVPFTGALAAFADTLRWTENEPVEAASLRPQLDSFRAAVGGPWPAACSLWGQIYFNTLLIPAACWLAKGGGLGAAARLSPMFCTKRGTASCFLIYGERRIEPRQELAFLRLVEAHVGRVIDELAEEGGLSQRMLWESAGTTLRWVAAEIAEQQSACTARLKTLALRANAGSRLAHALAEDGAETPRKLCCLRYRLDGFAECPRVCPRLRRE